MSSLWPHQRAREESRIEIQGFNYFDNTVFLYKGRERSALNVANLRSRQRIRGCWLYHSLTFNVCLKYNIWEKNPISCLRILQPSLTRAGDLQKWTACVNTRSRSVLHDSNMGEGPERERGHLKEQGGLHMPCALCLVPGTGMSPMKCSGSPIWCHRGKSYLDS